MNATAMIQRCDILVGLLVGWDSLSGMFSTGFRFLLLCELVFFLTSKAVLSGTVLVRMPRCLDQGE